MEQRFAAAAECHRLGAFDDAFKLCQELLALSPNYGPALHLSGVLALRLGQNERAVVALQAAAAAFPERSDFRNDLGEALRVSGRLNEAATNFQAVLDVQPLHAGATNNLGIVRHTQGRLEEARDLYRRAAALDPRNANAFVNLGVVLQSFGDFDAAREAFQAARAIAPGNAAILLNFGNLYLGQGDAESAEALYREALTINANSAAAWVNLGRTLKEQSRTAEALSACVKARTLDPNLPAAHWNEGLCRLLLGDLARGWQGFAWRWRADAVPTHGLTLPEWTGESLHGRHLLVHAEQGLGDTIQFVRFVPLLKSLGPASITILAQPGAIDLLRDCTGAERVIGPDGSWESCDVRVPLLDLPLHLKIGLPSVTRKIPYLSADPAKLEIWRKRIAAFSGKRVGIVWKGRSQHANDRNRSIRLDLLAPLWRTPGIDWLSLQKDTTPDEGNILDAAGVKSLADDLIDLTDTAAAIMALDLVVTVDTSIAHLAGALGKPVWIMLPIVPDWRWLLARTDSPWYPSARLFRQSTRGDWQGVVEAIAHALSSSR